MNNPKVSTDIIYRVFDENEGVFLEIGPDEEGLGLEIRTTTDKSKEWWGKVSILMGNPAFVEQLGQALIKASKEMKGYLE